MDLARFDTREAAEAGTDVPLVIEGETIYGDDNMPVTFRLRGLDSEAVHSVVLKTMNSPGKTPKEVIENDLRLLRAAVIGWSGNFTVEGEKIPFSRDAIDRVMSIPEIRVAVTPHVFRRQRFFSKP